MQPSRFTFYGFYLTAVFLLFLGFLSSTRLLYEAFFPRFLWLGHPLWAGLLSAVLGVASLQVGKWASHLQPKIAITLWPLLLNLLYLFEADVNLIKSCLIFAASLWLTAVLIANRQPACPESVEGPIVNHQLPNLLLLLTALGPIYLLTMPHAVGRADTFEFQVVVPNLGIVHPTGYPLYLLLGKLWTLFIPAGSVAWRLNVGTAVFALLAACFLYLTASKLFKNPVAALLGAVAFGLTPTFWGQAIEAEVYTLHALVVAGALWLMTGLIANGQSSRVNRPWEKRLIYLFFIIGLGLTNHLTTLFLLPPAAFTFLFVLRYQLPILKTLPKLALTFLIPLSLYLYLPLRWQAVNGEAMGFGRFVDWVAGGRFQDALQWGAWLHDPNRYEIIGRLFLDNWGRLSLGLILVGFFYLLYTNWRITLILFITWLGFTFYALNYYVPDLAVFIIPSHLVMGVAWAAGAYGLWVMGYGRLKNLFTPQPLIATLLIFPVLVLAVANWPQMDRSGEDGLITWGMGVLNMPLADGAAILADSEKIAPLYYLQQAEGIRPDLDIMVLPDEVAYRAELDGRLAAGQVVYLARFLPGLEGIYHLRPVGPLTEVSTQPMMDLPENGTRINADGRRFGGIELVAYELEADAMIDPMATAVTFYWRTTQPVTQTLYIYTRWEGETATSQHPANNYYPTTAWEVGEIVPDFHLLPKPVSHITQTLQLQIVFAPPFSPPDDLNWQTVTTIELPPTPMMTLERPFRSQMGSVWLTGGQFPTQIRPQTPLPVLLSGYGDPQTLQLSLTSSFTPHPASFGQSAISNPLSPFLFATELNTHLPNGRYFLMVTSSNGEAICGWLASATTGCLLGEVEISGIPLPAGATNFEDKITLLDTDIPQTQLQPGGQLQLTLTWQSLAAISEDYTVFVQVLDAHDQMVGQVDVWPRQGTHPTSQWQPGEVVQDVYTVQLAGDLQPGEYRLLVGWYLLGTLQRLQVVDETGTAVNDKVEIPGLTYFPEN